MNFFDNWFVQAIIVEFALKIFHLIIVWLKNNFNNSNVDKPPQNLYSKRNIKKQFSICFWISSLLCAFSMIYMYNSTQNRDFQFLICLIGIVAFFCFLLILGAFDVAIDYMPNETINKEQNKTK